MDDPEVCVCADKFPPCDQVRGLTTERHKEQRRTAARNGVKPLNLVYNDVLQIIESHQKSSEFWCEKQTLPGRGELLVVAGGGATVGVGMEAEQPCAAAGGSCRGLRALAQPC